MDGGTLVAGEPDVADLAGALRRYHRFQRTVGPEHPLRVRHPDHLVELHEVDAVGLEPAQRLIDLLRRRLPVATVDLGHEKHFVAIAVAQRLAHADLARPTVVVPAVVEEVDSVVDRGADDADRFLLVSLPAEGVAAHTDQRHHFLSAPQAPVEAPPRSGSVSARETAAAAGWTASGVSGAISSALCGSIPSWLRKSISVCQPTGTTNVRPPSEKPLKLSAPFRPVRPAMSWKR